MDDDAPADPRPDDVPEPNAEIALDDVDRGILFALQRDARNITIQEIAELVGVSASTVRNRIDKLETTNIIDSYAPQIDYERAGFPLKILFIASADPDVRNRVAEDVLAVDGVVDVNELVTSERNLHIQGIATSTRDLTRMTGKLNEYGVSIHSSEIITNHYSQPWGHFKFETNDS